jgi:hypothetical protein
MMSTEDFGKKCTRLLQLNILLLFIVMIIFQSLIRYFFLNSISETLHIIYFLLYFVPNLLVIIFAKYLINK